jgi:hypothetical protein
MKTKLTDTQMLDYVAKGTRFNPFIIPKGRDVREVIQEAFESGAALKEKILADQKYNQTQEKIWLRQRLRQLEGLAILLLSLCLLTSAPAAVLNFAWDAPTNYTPEFYFLWEGNQCSGNYSQGWVATTNTLAYDTTNLLPGRNYFAVTAMGKAPDGSFLFSGWSNEFVVTNSVAELVTVVNLHATNVSGEWTAWSTNQFLAMDDQGYFRSALTFKRTNVVSYPHLPTP